MRNLLRKVLCFKIKEINLKIKRMSQNTIQNKRKQNHQVKKSFIAKQTKVVRQGPGNIIF